MIWYVRVRSGNIVASLKSNTAGFGNHGHVLQGRNRNHVNEGCSGVPKTIHKSYYSKIKKDNYTAKLVIKLQYTCLPDSQTQIRFPGFCRFPVRICGKSACVRPCTPCNPEPKFPKFTSKCRQQSTSTTTVKQMRSLGSGELGISFCLCAWTVRLDVCTTEESSAEALVNDAGINLGQGLRGSVGQ